MWSQIQILGNLGQSAEMKYTPSGQVVTSFSVAASRSYKKGDDWHKETTWFRCEAWGKTAEVCAKLEKGAKVFIVGRLKTDATSGAPRIWKTQSGEAKTAFEVTVNEIKFLDKKQDAEKPVPVDVPDEEMPF